MLKFMSWEFYLKGLLIIVPLYYLVVGTLVFRSEIAHWLTARPKERSKAAAQSTIQLTPSGGSNNSSPNSAEDLDGKLPADSHIKTSPDPIEKDAEFQGSVSFPNLNDLNSQPTSISSMKL